MDATNNCFYFNHDDDDNNTNYDDNEHNNTSWISKLWSEKNQKVVNSETSLNSKTGVSHGEIHNNVDNSRANDPAGQKAFKQVVFFVNKKAHSDTCQYIEYNN